MTEAAELSNQGPASMSTASVAEAFAAALCGPATFACRTQQHTSQRGVGVLTDSPQGLFSSCIDVKGEDGEDSDSGAVLPCAAARPALLSLSLTAAHTLGVTVCASTVSGCEVYHLEMTWETIDSFFEVTVGLEVGGADKVATYAKQLCGAFQGVHRANRLGRDLFITLVFEYVQGDLQIPYNCTASHEVFEMMCRLRLSSSSPTCNQPASPRPQIDKGKESVQITKLERSSENTLANVDDAARYVQPVVAGGPLSTNPQPSVKLKTKKRIIGGTSSHPFTKK